MTQSVNSYLGIEELIGRRETTPAIDQEPFFPYWRGLVVLTSTTDSTMPQYEYQNVPTPDDDDVSSFFESLLMEPVDYGGMNLEVTTSIRAIADYLGPLQQLPSDQ